MVIRLKEGKGEEVVPPLGEMWPRGVVEPGDLVWVGEEGVHGCRWEWEGERERERGGEGYITGTPCPTLGHRLTHTDRGGALNLITASIQQEESKHRVAENPTAEIILARQFQTGNSTTHPLRALLLQVLLP